MTIVNEWPIQSLEEFKTGSQFPPQRENSRYSRFIRYERLVNRQFSGLVAENTNEEASQLRFNVSQSGLRLQPNIFRFLLNFWKDAIISDAPTITYRNGGRQQELIDLLHPTLVKASESLVTDLIKFGCGVFTNFNDKSIQSVSPLYWFPVRPGYDLDKVLGDIIAIPWSSNPNGTLDKLNVSYWNENEYKEIRYSLEGIKIGAIDEEVISSSLPLNPVVSVVNGDSFFGQSDFEDILEYVAELHRRETAISESLDKQANPHLQLPSTALSVNADGTASVDIQGMVIPVEPGDPDAKYLVWDASFESQEEAIKRAEDRIYQFTQVSPILLRRESNVSSVISGTALRRLAIPTVNKIRNIRALLDDAYRDCILIQASNFEEVIEINKDDIEIEWPAELSGGILEEEEVASGQQNSNATESN